MFVKKYYQFKSYMDYRISKNPKEIYWFDDYYEEYEDNNYGYVRGREDFVETIKNEICDATFSYFPELKPKEPALRPVCEKIIEEESAYWLYEHLFDLILGFYENKPFDKEIKECAYKKVKTAEEIEKEAKEFIKECNAKPEDHDYAREIIYNGCKNDNHYNYYHQVLHKAILRCVSHIFKEIPELDSSRIRYINYITFNNMNMLHFELFEAIAGDTVPPYE